MEEKEKIEESEMIKKIVEELKKIWAGNIRKKSFTFSLSETTFPKVLSPSLLERVLNRFLKEFDWKKFKRREYLETELGLFISAFLEKNISSQENKDIEVRLKVKEIPIVFKFLGYQNPKKLHLIVDGNCGLYAGKEMVGGKIIIKGNCGDSVGQKMRGGMIIIKGNCGDCAGWIMQGGKIIIKGNCGNFIGWNMRNGKIIIKGRCGHHIGEKMRGGELSIKGEVVAFDESAFSSDNKGTIIWKNIEIWRNGDWTKKGREMRKRGEIPVS